MAMSGRLAKALICCPAEPVGLFEKPVSETLGARDPETRFLLTLSLVWVWGPKSVQNEEGGRLC